MKVPSSQMLSFIYTNTYIHIYMYVQKNHLYIYTLTCIYTYIYAHALSDILSSITLTAAASVAQSRVPVGALQS